MIGGMIRTTKPAEEIGKIKVKNMLLQSFRWTCPCGVEMALWMDSGTFRRGAVWTCFRCGAKKEIK